MKRRDFYRALIGLPLTAAIPGFGLATALAEGSSENEIPGGSITDVSGLKVGHCTLTERPTGCTVVLCDIGAVAGADGLDTATGVMRYLEEHKMGYPIGPLGVVPIVPAAILMDLGVGGFSIRPTADSGYKACVAASSGPVEEGCVGAGAGATVGKMFGPKFAMKSGLGTESVKIGDTGIVVGAIVAVNAVGDVRNPLTQKIIAVARNEDGKGFRDAMAQILGGYGVVP